MAVKHKLQTAAGLGGPFIDEMMVHLWTRRKPTETHLGSFVTLRSG